MHGKLAVFLAAENWIGKPQTVFASVRKTGFTFPKDMLDVAVAIVWPSSDQFSQTSERFQRKA
jgi:hypothetical protein